MEEFFIGQIFEGEYPPEAAEWCNNRGDCYIDEIESAPAEVEVEEQGENGDTITHTETQIVRRFEIKEVQPETEEEKRMRLNMLSLTKADVLLALYEDKGLTPEDIKAMLKDNVPALIKFDYASSYYRGDEVVNALGLALGYTTEEMDYLFENKTFPPKSVEPVEPADTDSDTDVEPEA